MDEPRKGDKSVDIKAWKASIDASEEHLGTGTRREEIFIRAAGILTNYSTRSVYDNQVWNKIPSSWASLRRAPHQLNMAENQERTLEEDPAVEEKVNSTAHLPRLPPPSSPISASTVSMTHEANPWQDAGTDIAQSSEPLLHEPLEAQPHHEYARSWPPALQDQFDMSNQVGTILELYDTSQPPTRRAFAAPPGNSRYNQNEVAGSSAYPPGDASSQVEEDESWLGAASDGFEPLPSSPNNSPVPQRDHDVEELLTPENFAKYKRYRRREKRAGRG
ncbi:hypothetical protein FDENT_7801 [Fusarium denticulatum]|uniref:Uncharacterized protein n=1 Tax=Fusarium denticulatum TaxID=48507 RepID=A0A8H5U163_9HYPO|nr:hypothetical protein FDENT_7801 [Fusarium denticulatum]